MSKYSRITFPAFLALLPLLSGCMAGIAIDQEGISRVGRIAVVSVVLAGSGASKGEKNRAVLQEGAERSLARTAGDLRMVWRWSVLDPSRYRGNSSVLSLAAPDDAELTALFPDAGDRDRARTRMLADRADRADLVGVKGFAAIPRSALVGPETRGDPAALARTVLLAQAGRLCSEIQADAVAFVEIAVSFSHPRPNVFLVKDGRTDGQLRMAQTVVIIDRAGRVIADLGRPDLAGNAVVEDYLPLYVGSGKSAVTRENADLVDAAGKVRRAVLSASDASSEAMIKALARAAVKQ